MAKPLRSVREVFNVWRRSSLCQVYLPDKSATEGAQRLREDVLVAVPPL